MVRNLLLQRAVSLRELAVTPAIPAVLFAAHERVPALERERLLNIILGWRETWQGRQFLAAVGRHYFAKAMDVEYDVVRAYARCLQLAD